jgi:hypothetical protein
MIAAERFIMPRQKLMVHGVSRPLSRTPAIVSFLNPLPALRLVGGNRSSCPRPWKNASAEDGGSTSIDQVMARAALIQDLRPGLLAVAVRHR